MGKFIVDYRFNGRSTETIEAETLEEAEASFEAKVDRDDFEIDADEIDDVDFTVREMHPVTRDGEEIWTTLVHATDKRGHASALLTTPLFGGGTT